MEKIEDIFNEEFKNWEIQLPIENIRLRQRGSIEQAGWKICYLFGLDDKGEYLDYYAVHRMTDDRHGRIYSDGTCQSLRAMGQWCLLSDDPEENVRRQKEFDAGNQLVAEMLKAKGFREP